MNYAHPSFKFGVQKTGPIPCSAPYSPILKAHIDSPEPVGFYDQCAGCEAKTDVDSVEEQDAYARGCACVLSDGAVHRPPDACAFCKEVEPSHPCQGDRIDPFC